MAFEKDHFIERVTNEVRIEAYISRYVNLKKSGKDLKGLCPFHSEKTPSFTVSPEKGFYYCYGCLKTGGIFKFVMDYERVDFRRAKEILSAYSGIPISNSDGGKFQKEREELFQINWTAMEYFSKNLESTAGISARKYLEGRGIQESIIKKFKLGYAPAGFEGLVNELRQKKLSLENAIKIGIIKKKSDGVYYDFFRERIIFPIFNVSGKVIAFGGRILDSDGENKYINSTTSPIYEKKKSFYNMQNASHFIRQDREAILVEGYLDVIGMVDKGFQNTIGTLGTSITQEHLQTLKSLADTVYFLMDGDLAGRKAIFRGVLLGYQEGISGKVILLENKTDPFDLSRKESYQEIRERFKSALDGSEFLIHEIVGTVTPISSLEEKKGVIKSLNEIIPEFKYDSEKIEIVRKCAVKIGMDPNALLKDLKLTSRENIGISISDTIKKKDKILEPVIRCERQMIITLLNNNALIPLAEQLHEMEFCDWKSAKAWEMIYTTYLFGQEINSGDFLNSDVEEDVKKSFAPLLLSDPGISDDSGGLIQFKLLHEQHKQMVIQEKMDALQKKGELDANVFDTERMSEISRLRMEKEKIREEIRRLTFSNTKGDERSN